MREVVGGSCGKKTYIHTMSMEESFYVLKQCSVNDEGVILSKYIK